MSDYVSEDRYSAFDLVARIILTSQVSSKLLVNWNNPLWFNVVRVSQFCTPQEKIGRNKKKETVNLRGNFKES